MIYFLISLPHKFSFILTLISHPYPLLFNFHSFEHSFLITHLTNISLIQTFISHSDIHFSFKQSFLIQTFLSHSNIHFLFSFISKITPLLHFHSSFIFIHINPHFSSISTFHPFSSIFMLISHIFPFLINSDLMLISNHFLFSLILI